MSDLRQTLALTLKRLATHQKEYDLLYYGLSSARIFFRPKDAAGKYRVRQVVVHLGSVGEFPRLVGRYCSYLLPKQDGGTFQI